jgi:methionine sulfoxide reductase heme-binding subunit
MSLPVDAAKRPSSRDRRVPRHVVLGVVSVLATALGYAVFHSTDRRHSLSLATAYSSTALLVYVLALGPLNVLRGRPNPVSTNLRRDAAIWAGTVSLLHLVVGLTVHLRGKMHLYFLDPDNHVPLHIRLDSFGVANYTGLVAGAILALLLLLSNDLSLRSLGTPRWKSLQRTNYVAIGLVVLHGAIYQVNEGRRLQFVAVFVALCLVALALQLAGIREVRELRRRQSADADFRTL